MAEGEYLGYYVEGNIIKDAKKNVAANIDGNRIVSYDQAFKENILMGSPTASSVNLPFNPTSIKYELVDGTTNQKFAVADSKYNVFSLDNLFLGTIDNSKNKLPQTVKTVISTIVVALLALLIITLIVIFATMSKTGKKVVIKDIIVSQGDGTIVTDYWDIFDDTIRPGQLGGYYFKLINNSTEDMVIYLNFSDENEYNIPMRYRLKNKDGYLCGGDNHWALINNIYLEEIVIPADSSQTFMLEWYWLDDGKHDEIDTTVGSKGDVIYTVNITLISNVKGD